MAATWCSLLLLHRHAATQLSAMCLQGIKPLTVSGDRSGAAAAMAGTMSIQVMGTGSVSSSAEGVAAASAAAAPVASFGRNPHSTVVSSVPGEGILAGSCKLYGMEPGQYQACNMESWWFGPRPSGPKHAVFIGLFGLVLYRPQPLDAIVQWCGLWCARCGCLH